MLRGALHLSQQVQTVVTLDDLTLGNPIWYLPRTQQCSDCPEGVYRSRPCFHQGGLSFPQSSPNCCVCTILVVIFFFLVVVVYFCCFVLMLVFPFRLWQLSFFWHTAFQALVKLWALHFNTTVSGMGPCRFDRNLLKQLQNGN